MEAAFDHAAQSYDIDFTKSTIGKNQRSMVWSSLQSIIGARKLNVLELNCGTGEDAVWLAKQGHKVWATDVSQEMLNATIAKIKLNNCSNLVKTSIFNLKSPKIEQFGNEQFDLIFSNFGGFNCINPKEIGNLLKYLRVLVKKSGKMVLVVMPPSSLYENLKGIFKRPKANLKRAKNKGIMVNVKGKGVETWYYQPKQFENNHFKLHQNKPVGFVPSYATNLPMKYPKIYNGIRQFETFCWFAGILSSHSDHYIVELLRRK